MTCRAQSCANRSGRLIQGGFSRVVAPTEDIAVVHRRVLGIDRDACLGPRGASFFARLVVLASDDQIFVWPRDVVEGPTRLLGADKVVERDNPLGLVREVPFGDGPEPRQLLVQQPSRLVRRERAVKGRPSELERALHAVEIGFFHHRPAKELERSEL
jgi:hypothetical protein